MNRQEVRAFVKAAVDNLTMSFNNGRVTEFNSEPDKQYPYAWLESLSTDTELNAIQLPIETWHCVLHVMKKDIAGSLPTQYEDIVDECDLIAQRIIRLLNQEITGYKLVTLSSISRVPSIHKHADDLTGVVLSFDLTCPNTTDVC